MSRIQVARTWYPGLTGYSKTTRETWEKPWTSLYGAVIGDICGSIYEFNNRKTDHPEEIELINDACYFTDDTVLTAAIADATRDFLSIDFKDLCDLRPGMLQYEYGRLLWEWGNRYSEPCRSYGGRFQQWLRDPARPAYGSYGNGAAMRISPIAWRICEHHRRHPAGSGMGAKFRDELYTELLRDEVEHATRPTHGHPEGIKGAGAVGYAIYLAWAGLPKDDIRERITQEYGYDLSNSLAEIRPTYHFDETCQGTVPVAIIAFLESHDFVSAIQNAISVGGDSDTIAAITGSIAEAYYPEIPEELKAFARSKLPEDIQGVLGMISAGT